MNTEDYIQKHREDNVQQLALSLHGFPPEEARYILQQVEGWQRLRHKVPSWAAVEELHYPVRLSLEQCSSETTARYKASLVGEGELFIDLTGGLGVDFSFMARGFRRAVYVERNEALCQLARHNFPLLGLSHADVLQGTAEEFLLNMQSAPTEGGPESTTIYLDPFRRDDTGRKTIRIEDCTPNVLELLPQLLAKAHCILVKLSPMLDLTQAIRAIQEVAPEVSLTAHIVGTQGEVKEILLEISAQAHHAPLSASAGSPLIVCHEDDIHLVYSPAEDRYPTYTTTGSLPTSHPAPVSLPLKRGEVPPQWAEGGLALYYLYVPSATIMKAGCFRLLSQRYGVRQLHPNSHLYVSEQPCPDFPGRHFRILRATTFGKHELRTFLAESAKAQGVKGNPRANLAVRNIPMTVQELRKRLKVQDGGAEYWFATTLEGEKRILLACEKA